MNSLHAGITTILIPGFGYDSVGILCRVSYESYG